MKDFGSRLRQLREQRGLSQREFAEMAAIDVMVANRYERGIHLPSVDSALKIARFFQMTVDELLTGRDGNSKPPEIKNAKLHDRFRILDGLPRQDQDVVLQVADAVIAKRKMTTVLEEQR